MYLRRLEIAAALFALIVGASLPAGVLTAAAGSLLVTFLGLVAASILPTITLMLSSMSAGGRSVLKLGELHDELRVGIRTLFFVFGWTIAAVAILVVLALPMPGVLARIPYVGEAITRTLQGLSMMLAGLALIKARAIPDAIHRCLDLMADIAKDDARKRTIENAPKTGETTSNFKTQEGFGRVRTLDEIRSSSDPH